MMKPRIYWYKDGGCYICEIPESTKSDDYTEAEWEIYYSCGAGRTIRKAYEDWLKENSK